MIICFRWLSIINRCRTNR